MAWIVWPTAVDTTRGELSTLRIKSSALLISPQIHNAPIEGNVRPGKKTGHIGA
jgi:hypothetical protein